MANLPITAIGEYSSIQKWIDEGTLSYPAWIITTDSSHYNRLMFLNKDLSLRVINGNGDGVSSYDELSDVPITNKTGTAASPVVLSSLSDGIYAITGSYQYVDGDTTYVTPNSTLFVIGTDEYGNKYVTKYGFYGVEIYYVDSETNTVTTDKYVTESWIDENIVTIDTETIKNLF